MIRAVLTLLLLTFSVPVSAQKIIYVDGDAAGSGDGTSWINAYASLQDALAAAEPNDQVWVASGKYRPDDGTGITPGDRSASFELKSGLRVHGGFLGTESSLSHRDPLVNPTTLSGDLNADDEGFSAKEDNSYHVVKAVSVDASGLLDSFTIVGDMQMGARPIRLAVVCWYPAARRSSQTRVSSETTAGVGAV